MPFYSGSAVDLAALLTALRNACTSNGWTLSGEILHKGDSYQRVRVNAGAIEILGGTGVDGGNLLTGGNGANVCSLGQVGAVALSFPMAYEIHVHDSPDEVYLFARWDSDRFTWLSFGLSDIAALPGTGGWYGASRSSAVWATLGMYADGSSSSPNYSQPGLFWRPNSGAAESFIHHGLDGGGWSASGNAHCQAVQPLIQRQPNAWNSNAILLPTLVTATRASSKVSVVADLGHCRQLRIDNYEPQDIITLGGDRWKVYPWFRKNAGERNGPTGFGEHTGTLGCAIRYDGP